MGLPGVSKMTRPVSGRIDSATVSGVAQVTVVPSRPVVRTWSLPPYSGRIATMCGVRSTTQARSVAVSAAMPVANATASSHPSSAATERSNRSTPGFHSRW